MEERSTPSTAPQPHVVVLPEGEGAIAASESKDPRGPGKSDSGRSRRRHDSRYPLELLRTPRLPRAVPTTVTGAVGSRDKKRETSGLRCST